MLYIVSTPIGNLEDITLRALRILFTIPIILAEDTRRTGNLLDYYRKKPKIIEIIQQAITENNKNSDTSQIDIQQLTSKPRYISFHEHNENRKIDEIISLLKSGQDIALISDAGTPLISDPGFKLLRRCLSEKIRVVSIPGPSAWITALTSSGVPSDRVLFLGYLSPRSVRRRKELHQLKENLDKLRKPPTIILYESPHRLLTTLSDILEVAGNIDVTIATELTKLHEKVTTKPVSLWVADLTQKKKIKGEYTILFRF